MGMLRILALAGALALAGCSAPDAGEDQGTTGEGRSARFVETSLVRVYHGERMLSPGSPPEDASFTVPEGAKTLVVTFFANETAPCGEGHGSAPPREGEVFPNPFLDFIAPSGRVESVESSVVSGCPSVPGSNASYSETVTFAGEAGAWQLRHDWRGTNLRLTVVVDAAVPAAASEGAA